ncbi:hypothetical protein EZS27_011338 [termite gut metagenome]|uniref:Uncharacterized protein n=1 Tax=termite gut metagenome TaxID=433724 RepID=A0A5J4S644_9ZZZZ
MEDSYEAEDQYMEEEPFYETITPAELSDTEKKEALLIMYNYYCFRSYFNLT